MRIIDLSYPISSNMNIYPGDPEVKVEKAGTLPNILRLGIASHHGTHIDAPYHHLKNGKFLDSYPAEKFINKACRIDLSKENIRAVTKDHLIPYSELTKQNRAVIIRTGYDTIIKNGLVDKNFPYLEEDAAEYLSSFRNLNIVGMDSLTIDAHNENKAHIALLSRDVLILETIVNLSELPDEFILICFPLLIKNSDGAPCRAIAIDKNFLHSHLDTYTRSS